MLKGKAKTDYQRRYMREYRLKKRLVRPPGVRPNMYTTIPQSIDADGNPLYDD